MSDNRKPRLQEPAPPSAAGDSIGFMEQRRANLIRARNIALDFGDVALALERTGDLRKLYEDHLRGRGDGCVVSDSRKLTPSDQLAALPRDRVLSGMEQDMLFIRNLRRAVLQFGELETIQTCSHEIEKLEWMFITLKHSTQDEKPKGILALMGVER